MYQIIPYKSIGPFNLNIGKSDMELVIGNLQPEYSKINPQIFSAHYDNVNIEFYKNVTAFIGISSELNIELNGYRFKDQKLQEILNYFKSFPDNIYSDSSVCISEYLGLTVYFEDDELLEIGVFSLEYKKEIISGLNLVG